MANLFETSVLMDTNKKTVIKLTGTFDGVSGQETANTKIQGRNMFGALAVDSNNAVLVSSGGTPRTNYNYAIERITGIVNIPNGYVQIKWDGGTPATVAFFSGNFDWNAIQTTCPITNNATNPNGNVTFTTANANTAGASYTIQVEIHKGPNQANQACDFSMGQTAKPSDFNFGNFSVRP